MTVRYLCFFLFFFFNDTATTEIYTLSLHDALPILRELRANSNRCDAELKGDFVFPGTAEEKMISSVDGDVEYLIPVTILRPQGGVWKNIMIYFHGGGWTWGSRKSHMKLCEMISQ